MTEDQVREALHQQGLYVVDMSFEDPPPAAQPHDAGPLVFSVCFFHAVLSRMRVFLCRCDEKVLDWRVTCSHTLAGFSFVGLRLGYIYIYIVLKNDQVTAY